MGRPRNYENGIYNQLEELILKLEEALKDNKELKKENKELIEKIEKLQKESQETIQKLLLEIEFKFRHFFIKAIKFNKI